MLHIEYIYIDIVERNKRKSLGETETRRHSMRQNEAAGRLPVYLRAVLLVSQRARAQDSRRYFIRIRNPHARAGKRGKRREPGSDLEPVTAAFAQQDNTRKFRSDYKQLANPRIENSPERRNQEASCPSFRVVRGSWAS